MFLGLKSKWYCIGANRTGVFTMPVLKAFDPHLRIRGSLHPDKFNLIFKSFTLVIATTMCLPDFFWTSDQKPYVVVGKSHFKALCVRQAKHAYSPNCYLVYPSVDFPSQPLTQNL